MDKAGRALLAIGLEHRNYPLHIIANHFRAFVRSCGEYALAILPLNKTHISMLERHQYRAIKLLIKSETKVSRLKLLVCLGLETVRLRYNLLSAKWFYQTKYNKGPEFLVKQAFIDFTNRPSRLSHSSSFYHPAKNNSITKRYLKQFDPTTSSVTEREHRFATTLKATIDTTIPLSSLSTNYRSHPPITLL